MIIILILEYNYARIIAKKILIWKCYLFNIIKLQLFCFTSILLISKLLDMKNEKRKKYYDYLWLQIVKIFIEPNYNKKWS